MKRIPFSVIFGRAVYKMLINGRNTVCMFLYQEPDYKPA
jgi:hypothetical protein